MKKAHLALRVRAPQVEDGGPALNRRVHVASPAGAAVEVLAPRSGHVRQRVRLEADLAGGLQGEGGVEGQEVGAACGWARAQMPAADANARGRGQEGRGGRDGAAWRRQRGSRGGIQPSPPAEAAAAAASAHLLAPRGGLLVHEAHLLPYAIRILEPLLLRRCGRGAGAGAGGW